MNPSDEVDATTASDAVDAWARNKQAAAVRLYAALAALVGDVERLHLTDASLTWRAPTGVQGSWREAKGVFWLSRILWAGEERQSEQLVLALETVGEGEDRAWLAHPTGHYCRSADHPVVGCEPDTPQLYEAALALVTQLGHEVRTMLLHLGAGQEPAAS